MADIPFSKRETGRVEPSTGAVSIHLRVAPDDLAILDEWISSRPDRLTRPEAIRRLVQIGAHCEPYVEKLLNHLEEASRLETQEILTTVNALREALGKAEKA